MNTANSTASDHMQDEPHAQVSVSSETGENIKQRFPELASVDSAPLSEQIRIFSNVLNALKQELDDVSH